MDEKRQEKGEIKNPKLEAVASLLSKKHQACVEDGGKKTAKGILFTKTRENTKALKAWLDENPDLSFITAERLVGTGKGEGQNLRRSFLVWFYIIHQPPEKCFQFVLKSDKGFKLITLLKCTFQGMKKTPARTIPNSSYSNTRELFHTGPVIDQSGKILSFFRTEQLNPVPMFRTAKIATIWPDC